MRVRLAALVVVALVFPGAASADRSLVLPSPASKRA
jgi:hypothetical protein